MENKRIIAQINLTNIAYNIKNIKKYVSTKVMAIIKADAYGHGAIPVSQVCADNGADWLGVATIEEALDIRTNGVKLPILILGDTVDNELKNVVEYNITQTIFCTQIANKLSKIAMSLNKHVDVHIKIDTGMNRIGFSTDNNSIDEILKISKLPFINVTGIFSHFATSDSFDKAFSNIQFNAFMNMVNKLNNAGLTNIITHISNSGAILDLSEYNLDMVRAGILLYGIYPSNEVKHSIPLKRAMTIKSYVSFVKDVGIGNSISYNQTYHTTKITKIATIPVGYADGYRRAMSNCGRVFINGSYANIIGSVCMDQFMVDVSGINVSRGDTVILMGDDITVYELASIQNSIPYEVICAVSRRVPRVYIK